MTKLVAARRFVILLLLCRSIYGACSVTSPASGSTQSGVVTWTATLTSLSSAASVDWIFDDFRVLGHVTASPWSLVNYNTGWNLDGPGNVKIIVRDATGAAICTSSDVAFTTNNFGMGITINAGSTFTSFNPTPTVSGTMILDISGNFSADVNYGVDAIDGVYYFAKTSPGQPQYPTGATYRLKYDTTKLQNGLHLFTWAIQCSASSANCGSTADGIGGALLRAFVGGVFNVNNGSGGSRTLSQVISNITDVALIPGDTLQLNPLLLYSDGSTASPSSVTYIQDNACLHINPTEPQLPMQCIGETNATRNVAEGANYVSVNGSGLVTASSTPGLTFVNIIDNTSGKVSTPIPFTVQAIKTVRHLGTCGTVYSTYHAGGACPSVQLTSSFNTGPVSNSDTWPDLIKSGFTGFEDGFHQGGNGRSTFSSWLTAWQANNQTPISAALTGLSGMSFLLRGEGIFQDRRDTIEVEQGPSAPAPKGGGTYAGCTNPNGTNCDPLGYELDWLQSTGRVAAHLPRDESEGGLGFNIGFSYNMVADQHTTPASASQGIYQIVVSGCPGACQAQFYAQGEFNGYGAWSRYGNSPGDTVNVTGATNSFLNGQWATTTNGYYCTQWNVDLRFAGEPDTRCAGDVAGCTSCSSSALNSWIAAPCGIATTIPGMTAAPNTGGWGPGSCSSSSGGACSTCTTSAANGTYTVSTDANLAVAGYGPGPCFDCSAGYGGETQLNDSYKFAIAKFQSHGIPSSWCLSAGADIVADPFYQGNSSVSDFYCGYWASPFTNTMQFGQTFWSNYYNHYAKKWDLYTYPGTGSSSTGTAASIGCCQWRQDAKSYSSATHTVPYAIQAGIGAETFDLGGRFPACSPVTTACSNVSGALDGNGNLTFIAAHGLASAVGSMGYVKIVIAGNSDSTISCTSGTYTCAAGRHPAIVTGTNTVRVFGQFPPNGCDQGNVSPNLPHGIVPGTTVSIAANGITATILGSTYTYTSAASPPSLCAGTYAFGSYGPSQATNYMHITQFLSSTGSGGTVIANDDMGQFNPLYDAYGSGSGRFGAGGTSGYLAFLAGWGHGLIREYQLPAPSLLQGQWGTFWPLDKSVLGFQSNIMPGSTEWANFQQRWWDNAQGLNFVKRAAPFNLQTEASAPFIAPGPPFLVTSMKTSAAYGNILTVNSFSEMPITATFNLGSLCQIGSNPISVYHLSFPHDTTELLTGAQGTVTYTWDPGEAIAFLCHATGTSFVQPYSISFAPAGGTVKTIVTAVHGNYSGALNLYFQSNAGNQTRRTTVCSSSPCTINIDTGMSDVYYNLTYLDGSNNVLGSTSSPIDIPASSGASTAPTVSTTTATSLTSSSASSGGTVTSNGGASVTSEGVCYGTTANPTSSCTSNGTATPFTSSLASLSASTKYYYQAFATNSVGTSYGGEGYSFTTLSSGGGGSGTLVQQTTCSVTSGTAVTCTLPSAPAAGDGLFLTWGSSPASATISNVSGGGVTWAKLVGSSTNRDAEIWCGPSSSGSGTTISITANAACSGSGCLATVAEFSGYGCKVDQAPSGASGTSAIPTTPSITNTNANDLILAVSRDADTGNLVSGPTNSFTSLHSPATTDVFNAAYRIVSATGAYSTGWTISGSQPWDAVIVSLTGGGCVITTGSPLPAETVGATISQTIATSGCASPTFAVSGSLPNGLSLNTSTGVISGTATTAGTFTPTISVTDANGNSSQPYSWTVNPAPAIQTSSPLPAAAVGAAYSQQLTATGGTGTLNWTITSGTLAGSGLSLSTAGLVSGTPLSPSATYSFTATATDSAGVGASKAFSISVTTAPAITSTSPLPGGSVGTAYSFTFAAAGDTPITWSAMALPSWSAFNTSTGVLSGTPNAASVSSINVTASNAAGSAGPIAFSLTINAGPAIQNTSPLPSAFIGVPYLLQLTAAGGKGTLTWSISAGTLTGSGLSMSSSGLISGTPIAPTALYNFTVTATDSAGANGSTSFQLQVTPPTPGPGSSANSTKSQGSVKIQ